MKRSRARLVSLGFVLGTALVSGAYAGLTALDNPASTRPIPPNTPGAIVFSVRNTGPNALQIGAANPTGPAVSGCMSITLTPYNQTPPYDLAVGQQAQYVATTNGFAATSSCTFGLPVMDLSTMAMTETDVQVVFNIAGSGSSAQVELQAHDVDFGSQTTFAEDQLVVLSDYGGVTYGSYTLQLAGPDPSAAVHFVGGCMGTSCTVNPTSNAGGTGSATLECQPLGSGVVAMTLQAFGSGSGSALATSNVTCRPAGMASSGIAFQEPMVTVAGPAGTTAIGSAHVINVGGSNALTSVALSAGPFVFAPPTQCTGTGPCAISPPLPLPPIQPVYFSCVPSASVQPPVTLTALGSDQASDVATITVACVANASGPLMTVNPTTIGPVSSPVGMPLAVLAAVMIGNSGQQPLTGVTVSANSAEWIADACTSTSCTVNPGNTQLVHMTFTPTAWNTQNATLTVSATSDPAHTAQVLLNGTGDGAILNPPSQASYNFGSISRGQSRPSPSITASQTGNVNTTVTFSNGNAAFTTAPSSLPLAPNGGGPFTISCESATPGMYTDTITLTADSHVYSGSPQSVSVMCNVVDTDVRVMPAPLDFHEVRIHSAPPAIPVTIVNAGQAAAVLHRVALSDNHGGQLGLAPAISTDMTLAPGDMRMVTLTLGTDAEVDLAGTELLVDVDNGIELSPAIDGKVVTAKSHVAPTMLDLGTACVGTQVMGTEMLVNDGTATLMVQQPVMDQGFTVLAQSPQNYPASLAPGKTATVLVKPAASAVGTVTGTLTWMDDVPSTYMVPVTVDYIPSGTAVSPAALEFGQVAIQVRSDQQTVTLQNCDAVATSVMLGGVKGLEGPAQAWDVEPSSGVYVLAPGQQLTLSVAFVPQEPGAHHGRLSIEVGGATTTVDLYGDATGPNVDRTSFYACTCSQGSPAGGWPIALAVIVIVRRRRGSSSPR